MKLYEMITAVREYPGIRVKLAAARHQLDHTRQALEKSEQECVHLSSTVDDQQYRLNTIKQRLDAFSTALSAFCPKLSTTEEMQRFYECLAPALDADGFKLYSVAQAITGFQSNWAFPYEDARGRFEEANGHKLMEFLKAYCFGAMAWKIVPGTTYESAEIGEVDTTKPEYLAFRKELYEKALRKMGFGDLLSPEAPQKLQNKETKGRSDHAR